MNEITPLIASLCCSSVHSRYLQVFELTREQERTKQAEANKSEAQYKAYAEQEKKVGGRFTVYVF